MSDNNQQEETRSGELLGDEAFNAESNRVAPSTAKGGQRAYCSVWNLHAYYGESYIFQSASFDSKD